MLSRARQHKHRPTSMHNVPATTRLPDPPARAVLARALVLPAALLLLGVLAAALLSPSHAALGPAAYAALHALLETFAVAVALLICVLGMSSIGPTKPLSVTLLAAAFLPVGLLDGLHTLFYAGMPELLTPASAAKDAGLWLAARAIGAAALLGLSLCRCRRDTRPAHRVVALLAGLGYAAVVAWLVIARPELLPAWILGRAGSASLPPALSAAIIAAHLATVALLITRRRLPAPLDLRSVLVTLVALTASEVCFALSTAATDDYNLVGHAYKTLALALLFRSLLTSTVRAPYRRLAEIESQQRATLERLQTREEQLSLVLVGSNDGIWDFDVTSGSVATNARSLEMLGYAPGELPPTIDTWRALIHPDDRPAVQRALQEHLSGQSERYEAEQRLRTRGGEWLWVLQRGKVVSRAPDGSALRLAGTQSDISARKRTEEERLVLERRAMESEKQQSLTVLAGGVAHDYNNMLQAILGYADLALAELPAASRARGYIETLHATGRQMAALTAQMLAFSGQGHFLTRPLALSELVQGISGLLQRAAGPQVELRAELAAELPPVQADASQIQQLLVTLVTNAAEAIGNAPGTVTLRTELRDVGAGALADALPTGEHPAGRYVALAVADTGHGMDEATRARMFEPFFSTKFTGRGLGLAAALGIVRGHRGAILVDTAPGEGTTITILLPAQS